MKILILGGTGAMGKHLANLLASENEINVTSRGKHSNIENIQYIHGNAKDILFLSDLLKNNYDAIVDFLSYTTEEFNERFSFFLNKTSHYLFLSSSRVYAASQTPLCEDSPRLLDTINDEKYLSTDEYALCKARCEDLLLSSKKNNWTIIRPYITYAENRFQLGVLEKEYWLFRAINGKKILFSEDIAEKTTTMTYGGDVARAIKALIGNPKALGEAFHITCDYSCSWNEILNTYLDILEKHLNRRPEVFYTKQSTNLIRGKYQILYDRYYNRTFDNSKIKGIVNTNDFLMPQEGLKMSLEAFLKKPLFSNFHAGAAEARADHITGDAPNFFIIPGTRQKINYILAYFMKQQ